MEEAFLHFIWKFQQFNHQKLQSDEGLSITVFEQGFKNMDAGPDFKNAKIKIGKITWNGNVEIHVKASDWKRHKHQEDPAYDNVILHVAWKNDDKAYRKDRTSIPTLELEGLIDENILINTVAPLLFAYGFQWDNDEMKEKPQNLLASLKPEDNSIIKKWKRLGEKVNSAFDSQALIERFKEYCLKKQCLNCKVGVEIIKSV